MSKTDSPATRPADGGESEAQTLIAQFPKEAERTATTEGEDERPYLLANRGPRPVASAGHVRHSLVQGAIVGIALVVLIAALHFGRPVLLPVVAAVVVAMTLGPISAAAQRYGIPNLLTALALWLLVLVMFYGLIVVLAAPVVDWIGKAPQIAQALREKLAFLALAIAAVEELREAVFPGTRDEPGMKFDVVTLAQPALTYLTPAIGQMIVFFGMLFFVLLGHRHLRRRMIVFFDSREGRLRTLRILNDIERNLTRYLSTIALINIGVGTMAGLIAYAVGLPSPLAWAMLGFVLNFVPYLGALIMELTMLAVGLVAFESLGHALIAPALYILVNLLEGHLITPTILGRRLTLSPLIVFMALVFWTWLWGPIGALLSVPLLIVGMVVLQHLFPKEEEPALPK